MAGSKIWTVSTLRSRGWTEELIRTLLPKPVFRHFGGRSVRSWSREDVLAAEAGDVFQAVANQEKALLAAAREAARQESADVRTAITQALETAIGEGELPDSPAGMLARRYHQAILRSLPGADWLGSPKSGKITGSVNDFLAAEKKGGLSAGPLLRRFVGALPWLGRNPAAWQSRECLAHYGPVLLALAGRSIEEFSALQPEADCKKLLEMEDFPIQELFGHPLGYIYSVYYIPRAIRSSLEVLVALNPKDEYPRARAMTRHFTIHIGGTNTGKTYAGFQRLIAAETGVYLAPLRLLALEAQETLLDAGVRCSLTTGEEEDCRELDTHVSATAEKLDLNAEYDVAVIDECQMIADRERGYAWTRAILGVLAPEVHLCAAPQAKDLLIRLIRSCGDTYEVVVHQRKTPLICMNRQIDMDGIQPGDALIAFSKVGVLSLAEELRSRGKEPAIIYGALPYATRRKQVEGFLDGEMEYVCSTDAIGMGLNLPIRRIIFTETEKFDGVERRQLRPEEIQQIAGRAGRYGMYDRGYVGAMQDLSVVRAGLEAEVPPLEYAIVGFSDLVLNVDFDLLEVLTVWNRMPTVDPYIKLDISRYITIITRLREDGFELTREQELRAANIPFDETEDALNAEFHGFLRVWLRGDPVERPGLPEKGAAYTLPELELYCRQLDLYYSFCKAFREPVDVDELYDEREWVASRINQILLHNLQNNIRFCARCGRPLPATHTGRLCNTCYRKTRAPATPSPAPVGRRRRHKK